MHTQTETNVTDKHTDNVSVLDVTDHEQLDDLPVAMSHVIHFVCKATKEGRK